MVTAKTQYNLKNAREYFEEDLCVGDYYDEGQRVAGQWFGVGADQLGLMDTIEMHMDGFDKRVDSIETRMENGFYNIIQELQQIKKLIKQVNTREQVAALEVRVDILEKKIGT